MKSVELSKKIILVGVLGFYVMSNHAYAGCPGFLGCIEEGGKIISTEGKKAGGDISSEGKRAGHSLKVNFDSLVSGWHASYGELPDGVRKILNNYTVTAIGAYFGGLEGAILGESIQTVIDRLGQRWLSTQKEKEGGGIASWKSDKIDDAIGKASVQDIAAIQMYPGEQGILDILQETYEVAHNCILSADNDVQADECIRIMQKQMMSELLNY